MARDGVTLEELADSKRYLIGSMPRTLETNGGIASFLHDADYFGLGLDYDRRLPDAPRCRDARRRARRRADVSLDRSRRRSGWRGRRRRRTASRLRDAAVFFDVDFTLIYPGPTFRGSGYREFGARHGLDLDPARFDAAVRIGGTDPRCCAGRHLRSGDLSSLHRENHRSAWVARGPGVDACARGDVRRVGVESPLRDVRRRARRAAKRSTARGIRIGLISNSHRCLATLPEPLRARRPRGGGDLLLESRLSETSSQHLRGGTAADGRAGRRCRDGGRQRRAGHRRRPRHRHARGPGPPWRRRPAVWRRREPARCR